MAEQRRRRWGVVGIAAIAVGVAGAMVLWLVAGRRYDDAVAGLAPAPVGCETTLDFDRTGTFTFFVERRGEVDDIDGDCDNDDRDYDVDADDVERVTLTLLDPDGAEVDLDRSDGPTYDRNGSTGDGFRSVEIDDPGEYLLNVTSDQDEVVVRVGADPTDGVMALRVGAGASLLAGLGIGAVGLAQRGRSRRPTAAPAPPPSTPWPAGGHGAWPPTAPPYANPPVQPPYGRPPGQIPQLSPWPPAPPGRGGPLPPPPPPPPRR